MYESSNGKTPIFDRDVFWPYAKVGVVRPVPVPIDALDEVSVPFFVSHIPNGAAFTVGDITVAYGFLLAFPGTEMNHVAESVFVSTVPRAMLRQYVPSLYYKVAMATMDEAKEQGYTRVQCHVGNARDRHFAERVGFVHEGALIGYGPGGKNLSIMRLAGRTWQKHLSSRSLGQQSELLAVS